MAELAAGPHTTPIPTSAPDATIERSGPRRNYVTTNWATMPWASWPGMSQIIV
jgi:hypothetical protein